MGLNKSSNPFRTTHSWDVNPKQAIEIQNELRNKVKLQPLRKTLDTIGGADISFNIGSTEAYAVFIVFDFKTLKQIECSYSVGSLKFPYIPGLLSFREIPLLMEAWKKLTIKPDLLTPSPSKQLTMSLL